jgi:predicted lipoprotein with Yx(FWY)xxD motif
VRLAFARVGSSGYVHGDTIRTAMARLALLALLASSLLLVGCGGDELPEPSGAVQTETAPGPPAVSPATAPTQPSPADDAEAERAAEAHRPAGEAGLRSPAQRARIVVRRSEFGRVLFDANGQVVYVFERDSRDRSNCTSADCVEAWPPVLTREAPTAGGGLDGTLLGTIRRGDGALQVTYAGRPLYFYEHEAPGEIRCHDVDLHGGLWWVVTPSGEPA